MAKSKRVIKELMSALTEQQQKRFRQIRFQSLVAAGHRDQALNVFGISSVRDHARNVRIDRVKNAIAADFQLMKARELLGTVVSLADVDRAMGQPSFEFLDSQALAFGGAMSRERDQTIVPRKGSGFERLGRQAGRWYADAIQSSTLPQRNVE